MRNALEILFTVTITVTLFFVAVTVKPKSLYRSSLVDITLIAYNGQKTISADFLMHIDIYAVDSSLMIDKAIDSWRR